MKSQEKIFILLLLQALALTGSSLTGFALPLLLFKGSDQISGLGLLYFFQIWPGFLVSFLAGYITDRFSRRWVSIISLIAYLLNLACLGFFHHFNSLDRLIIYFFTINLSIINAFQALSLCTLISENVRNETRVLVNILLSLRNTVPRLLAPALSGFLVAQNEISTIVEIDFIIHILFLFVVFVLSHNFNSSKDNQIKLLDYKKVLSFIGKQKTMQKTLLSLLHTNATTSVFGVFIIPIALNFMNEHQIGFNLSMGGIGSVVGACCFQRNFFKLNLNHILFFSHLIQGFSLFFLVIFSFYDYFGLFLFFYFFTVPIQNGHSYSVWQESTNPSLYGRLFASKGMILQASSIIVFFLIGYIGDWILIPTTSRILSPDKGYLGLCFFISALGITHIIAASRIFLRSRLISEFQYEKV
ncbi:MAG: MFS transporter [Oligoflexales bacterium]